jgi:regulator of RNase E activity RraA
MSGKVIPQFRICAFANDDSEIDVPVCLYGTEHQIWVRPGDIIVGDADGVVCCPRFLAENVLALLPQLTEGCLHYFRISLLADEKVLKDVQNGRSVKDAFQEHRGKA